MCVSPLVSVCVCVCVCARLSCVTVCVVFIRGRGSGLADGPHRLQTKQRKVLEPVDHKKIEYESFRKNFYVEVPELFRMSPEGTANSFSPYSAATPLSSV